MASSGLPAGGDGFALRYDARAGESGEPPDPMSEAGGEWMWLPSSGDFSAAPHADPNGKSVWRIRRAVPTDKKARAWYLRSLTPQDVAVASRDGFRMRARIRLAPDTPGGFELGYLGDGRLWSATVTLMKDGSSAIVASGGVNIPFPADGGFHELEITLDRESRQARVTLDDETSETILPPVVVTNDPLTGGKKFLRGELTDAVYFGLAAGAQPGGVDVQLVEFESDGVAKP